MGLSELITGTIFTIDETSSYPKIRTEYGYLDMRDRIRKECDNLSWDIRIMTKKEVAERFGGTVSDIDDWIEDLNI